MSEQIVNIALGLVSAFLGYLIGRLWETMKVRRRYWKARQFWQPVVDGHFQIVTSRFGVDGFTEPTGLVGGGDAIANRLLGDLLQDIGLERPTSVYVDEPTLDRDTNLIVLGGPNENRVAGEAMERIVPGLRVVDPGPGIPMQVEDLKFTTDRTEGTGVYVATPSPDHMTDYGVIVRARSPFNADRAVVVISGAYGYGTWAGVQVSQKPEFLRRCEELDAESRGAPRGALRYLALVASQLRLHRTEVPRWAQVECLYKVDVIDRQPQACEIMEFRRIEDAQPKESDIRSSKRDGSFSSG